MLWTRDLPSMFFIVKICFPRRLLAKRQQQQQQPGMQHASERSSAVSELHINHGSLAEIYAQGGDLPFH